MACLILGASARAAAHSALRAGLIPFGIDLFADRDLVAVAAARRADWATYPEGLAAAAAGAPPGPWLYTGALENHPGLVDRLAAARPLWGTGGAALRAVRDPVAVAGALRRAGRPVPEVRLDPNGLPRDGSWLVKPLASAGGRAIRPLVPGAERAGEPVYFQERIAGERLAAVLLGEPPGATLLGVTRQWLGRPGSEFAYRGSLGPRPIAAAVRDRIEATGRALAGAFGLRGLFGLDLILRDDQPWPVEVNPRYTASVEVLELALGQSFLAAHRRVFDPAAPPDPGPRTRAPNVVGKAILFAPCACRFPDSVPWTAGSDPFAIPSMADLPESGTEFQAGEPVLTLFAQGTTLDACRDRLGRRLARWEGRLRPSPE